MHRFAKALSGVRMPAGLPRARMRLMASSILFVIFAWMLGNTTTYTYNGDNQLVSTTDTGAEQQIATSANPARRPIGESGCAISVGVDMVGPTLIAHGTEAQQQRFLDPLRRGNEVWCQLFSEPGAGSDLAALRTKAVRDAQVLDPGGALRARSRCRAGR